MFTFISRNLRADTNTETNADKEGAETRESQIIRFTHRDVVKMEINMNDNQLERVLNLSLKGKEPEAIIRVAYDQNLKTAVGAMRPKKLTISDIRALEGLPPLWLKKIPYVEIRLANDEEKILRELFLIKCNKISIYSLIPLQIDSILRTMKSVEVLSILACEENTPVATLSNKTLNYVSEMSRAGKGIKHLKLDNSPATPIYIPELIQFLKNTKFRSKMLMPNQERIRIKILNVAGKRADLDAELKKFNLLKYWSMQTRFRSYEIDNPKCMLKLTVYQCSIDDEGYDGFRKTYIEN